VFRTPIGFHDAYVAAPSQKAALEAWGADSNLFAQGIAEQVTDPELMEEPLARPGEVIRRVRGSECEHVAALGRQTIATRKEAGPRLKAGVTKKTVPTPTPPLKGRGEKRAKPPKPSRAELDEAEAALERAEERNREEVREIEREIEALERRRRDLLRRHERERDELAEARDRARKTYERALRIWEKS
jgi:hypothetical protein